MSEPPPFISIALPVYNGERYVRQALDALLAQTHTHFELLICDNASTDSTPKICAEYAARDSRIRIHRNESNVGALKNFQRAFDLTESELFMWAADDDLWEPTFLERCVDALDASPDAVLAYTDINFIDENGDNIPKMITRFDGTKQNLIRRVSKMVAPRGGLGVFEIYGLLKRSELLKTHMLQNAVAPDYTLLMELCLHGPFARVDEKLFHFRVYREKTLDDVMERLDSDNTEITFPTPWSDICLNLRRAIETSHHPWHTRILMRKVFFLTIAFGNPKLARQVRLEQWKLVSAHIRGSRPLLSLRSAALYAALSITGRVGRLWRTVEKLFAPSPS